MNGPAFLALQQLDTELEAIEGRRRRLPQRARLAEMAALHTTHATERARLQAIRDVLVRGRHRPIGRQAEWLGRVVTGYFRYFAIPGNIPALGSFRTQVVRYWLRALRRRSQKHRLCWETFGPRANR